VAERYQALHSLGVRPTPAEAEHLRAGRRPPSAIEGALQPVQIESADISVAELRGLLEEFQDGFGDLARDQRPTSDAWLAPRVHSALRLTRRVASDPGVWSFLANMLLPSYVEWRWTNAEGVVAENRYDGAVNKQAFARLWWGAELFRNGSDYEPVRRLFGNQDLPNSYLHRSFTRNRALALALLDALTTNGTSSEQVNDVARCVNLAIRPLSLEAAVGHTDEDPAAVLEWIRAGVPPGPDWSAQPIGPESGSVGPTEAQAAALLAQHVVSLVKSR
jgi:hypothetical protein